MGGVEETDCNRGHRKFKAHQYTLSVSTDRAHGPWARVSFFHTRVHEPCPCTRVSKNDAHPWTRASIHRRPKSPRAVDEGVFLWHHVHGHGLWTRVSKLSFLTSVDTGILCIYRA